MALLTGYVYRKVEESGANTDARGGKQRVAKRKREGGRTEAPS